MNDPIAQPVKRRTGERSNGKTQKNIAPAVHQIKRHDGEVAPFPREKFLRFCAAMMILSKDEGMVPFRFLGTQLYLLDEIEAGLAEGVTTFVVLKNRQAGVTTFFLALDLFWAFEYPGLLGVFATHEEASREQFRNQIDVFMEMLPRGFKVPENKNNAKMLILHNMSLFRYLVAGQRTQSNKLGRSGGCNYLHATETGFWGSADDLASLNQTLSEKFAHRLYVYESTANGYNHFETMWQVAKASPAQRAVFIGWWRDERNEFSEAHPMYKTYMPQGTRTPLSEKERDLVKAVKEQYGFRITAGQIAWYRYTLETKCNGDQAVMDQEQPSTEDDAFQSTGSIFFENYAIAKSMKRARKELCMPFAIRVPDRWQEMAVAPVKQITHATLKVWEAPSAFGRYAIGVDGAEGVGNDETVISVWRCYSDLTVQVAEWGTDNLSTRQAAWVLCYLAGLYRNCIVNIEVAFSGMSILQEVDSLRRQTHEMVGPEGEDMRNVLARMREFLYRRPDSYSGNIVRHWKTSHDTKVILMNRFKNYVELDIAQVRSLACLEQMRTIVIDEGSIEAAGAKHDDRPIAAALAVYAWHEYVLPLLRAQGLTYERAQAIERNGGEDQVQGIVRRFMTKAKIAVPQRDVDAEVA